MKKKIFILLFVIGGIIMFSYFSNTDNIKFRKNKSLESVMKLKPRYENLVRVSYSTGGSMNGEHHSFTIEYKDSNIIYTTKNTDAHYLPLIERVYKVTYKEAINELDAYVRKYNMSLWDKYPMSDLIALDGPSTSVNLGFKPESDNFMENVSISYNLEFPKECSDVLNQMTDMIKKYPKEIVDAYFLIDGETIHVNKNIDNSDEEIFAIIAADYADGNIIYSSNGGNARIKGIHGDTIKEYHVEEIIHEPYMDYDCGWYVRFTDGESKLIVVATSDNIYLEDENGKTYTIDRR